MAAVPPLIGFTAKEAAFESLVYLLPDGDQTGIPPLPAFLLMGALVAGSALTVAYTLRFLWGAFGTKPGVLPTEVTPWSRSASAAPVILAAASLVGGFVGPTLTGCSSRSPPTAEVGEESHGIALWHGFTAPLAMSAARPRRRCAAVRPRAAGSAGCSPPSRGPRTPRRSTSR